MEGGILAYKRSTLAQEKDGRIRQILAAVVIVMPRSDFARSISPAGGHGAERQGSTLPLEKTVEFGKSGSPLRRSISPTRSAT